MVGPERPLPRPVRFVREDPPGGGPAAALVTGLRAALDTSARDDRRAAGRRPGRRSRRRSVLADELERGSGVTAVVAIDATGRVQPLQLALSTGAAPRS